MEDCFRSKQGLCFLLFLCVTDVLCVSIHYSVPEEKKTGSLVANVLKDLKLGIGELSARRAQLVSKSSKQYFHLDAHSGALLINEKIDREALCGQSELCLLQSEIVLQNPLEFFTIEMKVEDVNDNAPRFSKNDFQLEIPENVSPNTRFRLESAQDVDLGENSIQNYTLSPNEYFRLGIETKKDGRKSVDLILEKPLDREKQPHLELILMALDGGLPQRTGTIQININILDINDNSPQFTQSEYEVRLKENSPRDTLVSKVEATDLDFGSNAQITYAFHRVPETISNLFDLNEMTGEITVKGEIDYEKETTYDMSIKATDGGGLSGHCNVLVEVEDVNDNAPEISVISLTDIIQEDSPLNTVVALFSVTDRDSGDNGKTMCSVEMNLPFVLRSTKNNYYQLIIQSSLDRERVSEYNVTITATDQGFPRLNSTRIIHVQISDVNDNTPVFEKTLFEMQLQENNIPGLLIGSVQAVDLDMEQNGKISYSLLPGELGGSLAASYISINSETGNMYALRSLDYEQIKDFKVTVRAKDGGTPPLSSDVVVRVVITDENDNAPFFLYPLQNSTSPCNELLPKMAEAGYLVTKVVAVDRDSGQNSCQVSIWCLKSKTNGGLKIEKKSGSLVANVLKDLKLGIGELSDRRAQLVSKGSKQYFHLDAHSGSLLINEKIDREALCGQSNLCLLQSEIVLQNPLELYTIEVKVEDVNDNAPRFSQNDFQLEIPENVPPNTRFPLESAQDVDLGENSIQNYTLSPNEYFRLGTESSDGRKAVDLILEKSLDREKQPHLELALMALDGEQRSHGCAATISELPVDKKRLITALRNEAHLVGGQQIISARDSTDCASKILLGSIALRRHTWLCSSELTSQARSTIEDMPFDNSGLFSQETDERFNFHYRMKTAPKKHGRSSSSTRSPRQRYGSQCPWYPPNQHRPYQQQECQYQAQDRPPQRHTSQSPSVSSDRRQPSQPRYQQGYKKKDT
ncbi:protocadherin beta-16-like [Sceloporus undulatus]|uniref:protocadherin beta-16-like n=1 Tax=Sceloporus undulatus TaxID=8520 RepID=UPI001C4AEE7B|nr:protocadherin beta-16-like [Sceloporus undulatus]